MGEEYFTDWELEFYLLGELPPDRMAAVRAREGFPELRQRLDALRKAQTETLGRYPAEEMARRIRQRAENDARAKRLPAAANRGGSSRLGRALDRFAGAGALRSWPVPAAGFAMVLVVGTLSLRQMTPAPAGLGAEPSIEENRIKGLEPSLRIFRQGATEPETLSDGSLARPGDLLQIAFNPAGRRNAALVSVDGNRRVTLHYPASPGDSTALPKATETVLPFAYELDGAPEAERFFLVVSARPFPASQVLRAAEALAASPQWLGQPRLSLPEEFGQAHFNLRKVQP